MARTILHDLNDEPVVAISVRAHRVVTAQGEEAVRTVLLILGIACLLGAALLFVAFARRED